MKLKSILLILSSALLSACSSTGLTLINAIEKLTSNHEVTANIAYGKQPWQKLDLHTPIISNKHDIPVLVFFYGGSWDTGKKEQYYFAAAAFAKLGYLVVIPDYIKYPQGKFPEFIQDGAAAISWVKNNINAHGGDASNVFIAGHSAGAHLGALLVSDKAYLQQHGLKPSDINAFAGLAGPYNFTPKRPEIVLIFEPVSNYAKMQIPNYIDGDEPSMLLAHGLNDTTVLIKNKITTIDALKEQNGDYESIDYPDVSHAGILLALSSLFDGKIQPANDIDKFFQKHLSPLNKDP
jgi:acetyl esterase/lipase